MELVAHAAVAEAERALEGALAVLTRAGLYGAGSSRVPVPRAFLLKLAACVRIYQWEQASLPKHLPTGLPSFAEVWDDLLAAPRTGRERFPAKDLARRVFGVWFSQMAWATPAPTADAVGGAGDVVDELAELLFGFRHLVEQRRPERPEEE